MPEDRLNSLTAIGNTENSSTMQLIMLLLQKSHLAIHQVI
jgi:hypothetical protein